MRTAFYRTCEWSAFRADETRVEELFNEYRHLGLEINLKELVGELHWTTNLEQMKDETGMDVYKEWFLELRKSRVRTCATLLLLIGSESDEKMKIKRETSLKKGGNFFAQVPDAYLLKVLAFVCEDLSLYRL